MALQEVVHLNFFPGPFLRRAIDPYLHKGSHPIRQGDNASVGGTKSAIYFPEGFDALFYVAPVDFHTLKYLLVVLLCSFYPMLRWATSYGEALVKTHLSFYHTPSIWNSNSPEPRPIVSR